VITINPTSNFSSEQTVYVAIGATVEDKSDNAITASSITFTAADSTAPNLDFTPSDSDNGIAINSDITIVFDEEIRLIDNTDINNLNVGSLITLKTTNSSGTNITFDATIDSDNKLITISPTSDFSSEQVIYVAIGATVEDKSDNAITASSITFTAADSTAPNLDFTPSDSDNGIAINSDITIVFDEEIRLIDNTDINNLNVGSLITLKTTNSSGTNITFDATIDSDNKVITIPLVSNLSSNQIVYVAIGETVEDSYNNAITAASATFTTGDSLPPTVKIEAVITASIATDSDITFTISVSILKSH
jgi:uncharacterized protein YrzB (UPF0473 family)